MARAALVVCAIAVAAVPVGAAQSATAGSSKYVVRGVVVQYIPPAGSVVGSLSIRVLSASRGRALLGELVTVPVARGKALNANRLVPQKSRCTVTLSARSPASILKGAAVVQTIVAGTPAATDENGQSGNSGQAPKVDPDGTSSSSSAGSSAPGRDNPGSTPSNDHATGQTDDHDSGKGGGASAQSNAPGSQGRGNGGNSNAHK